MGWPFIIGQRYHRRTQLHDVYGGSHQNGMISLPRFNAMALVTGSGGKTANYADKKLDDGSFRYTGEGQEGDMAFVRQNKLLRDHVERGLDVLLFEKDGDTPYLIYLGQFVCSSYDIEKQPDRLGAERDAIVFNLIPIGAEDAAPPTPPDPNATLAELRKRAYAAAGPARKKGSTGTRTVYERSADVKAYVLARASGTCEGCFKAAPFTTKAGMPYLEPHHIDRLSDGGPDDPRRVAATCPNCHKRAHFADDAKAFNDELRKRITKLEAQASKSANN